jgi:hypothetical protein
MRAAMQTRTAMQTRSWPKLVIEWGNSDIGWVVKWFRIHP